MLVTSRKSSAACLQRNRSAAFTGLTTPGCKPKFHWVEKTLDCEGTGRAVVFVEIFLSNHCNHKIPRLKNQCFGALRTLAFIISAEHASVSLGAVIVVAFDECASIDTTFCRAPAPASDPVSRGTLGAQRFLFPATFSAG